MNAPANIQADNLALWKALATTDPKHTKPFKRSGGFSGTAMKPIWIIRMLTEQFGPVGVGWGMGKPTFDLVHGNEGEVAVYCTVECWHGDPANTFYGVGGDKAIGKNKYGLNVDDEAFKKAFTDAVNNAFKFLGVGADIHMGQFDDSKYVQQVARDFAEREAAGDTADSAVSPGGDPSPVSDTEWANLVMLCQSTSTQGDEVKKHIGATNLKVLTPDQYTRAVAYLQDKLAKAAKADAKAKEPA